MIQHKILNIFHFIHFHCKETKSYPILQPVDVTQNYHVFQAQGGIINRGMREKNKNQLDHLE